MLMVSLADISYSELLNIQKPLTSVFGLLRYPDEFWNSVAQRVKNMNVNAIIARLMSIRLIGCAGRHEKCSSEVSAIACADREYNAGCFHVTAEQYSNTNSVLNKIAEGAVLVDVLQMAEGEPHLGDGKFSDGIRARLKAHDTTIGGGDANVASGYGYLMRNDKSEMHRVKSFPNWQTFTREQDPQRAMRRFELDVIDVQKVNSAVILGMRDAMVALFSRSQA